MTNNNNNNKCWIDIDVANCQIMAFKPLGQYQNNPMPVDDASKMLFFNMCPSDRLNRRVMGSLKGRGLQKARRIIDQHGAINMSEIYGSIEILESDFILPNK